jgi:ADP-ribose pyrophosphatase YjhB (NUDIX family)
MIRDQARCVVFDSGKLLMANHVEPEQGSFWCLPGGGVEIGESPAETVVRELWEECCVKGEVVRQIATINYPNGITQHTFECRIIEGTVSVGGDPEFSDPNKILRGVAFVTLDDVTTEDIFYLCQAGVMAVPEIERQLREISKKR